MAQRIGRWSFVAVVALVVATSAGLSAVEPGAPKDAFGRTTPRGTVLGFLAAARNGDYATAAEYLQVSRKDEDARELARQLFVVLDTRLPARLNQLSDAPEGSLPNPLKPAQDIVGTIASANGPVDILLARVELAKGAAPAWLFSRATLDAVPDLYDEASVVAIDSVLPGFLVNTRILGVRLYGWLAALAGVPLLWLGVTLLTRLLGFLLRTVARRRPWGEPLSMAVRAAPVRLLIVALTIEWTLAHVGLGIFARQFWTGVASMMTVCAVVWLLILVTELGERAIQHRSPAYGSGGAASLLRLLRRGVDLLIVLAGGIVVLRYFGINATAALAGLGVGGIAVALAAQKTLENVIAGVSLIADQAVRIGDFMKIGDVSGTVEYIGLRSTTIRTLDRTVVTIPNGQVAAVTLENTSSRDKFWFHPFLALRLDTPPEVVAIVVDAVEQLLSDYPLVDRESVRVRFLRFGPSSLDIEVFAYVFARDWNRFLEVQEELLIACLQAVRAAGARLALPAQSIQIDDERTVPDVNGTQAFSRGGYAVRRRPRQAT